MIRSWVCSSLQRLFPHTPVQANRIYTYDAARNERFSFQVGIRDEHANLNQAWEATPVACSVAAPKGWSVRIRRVGHIPVNHRNTCTPASDIDGVDNYPGFVPDPLFDEACMQVPPAETQAFYITVIPAKNVQPGKHVLSVTLSDKDGKTIRTHDAHVTLHDVVIKKRTGFQVTNWFYADAIIDWYKTDLFDARFFEITEAYFRNMVEHGQDTVYVPAFTPPLDGVKRPSQLLRITKKGKDRYAFDWRDVKTYIQLAKKCGITHFEWTHLFSQWGVAHALRIYEGQGRDEKLLWPAETSATSPVYKAFLSQFLPELKKFCEQEKILKQSFFHVSDEPHGEEHRANYSKARALLAELAPWMKVMDALSEIEFGRSGLTDMPVPATKAALQFIEENIPTWVYYCCGPRGLFINRLMDTPLPKIRMNGWLFYRWAFLGFLHWGYNYWTMRGVRTLADPFTVQDAGFWPAWAFGDTFLVYPGEKGPIDSLRYEAFADSLQEYALLQTLGVSRESKLLAAMKTLEDFPKTEAWIQKTRKALFAGKR